MSPLVIFEDSLIEASRAELIGMVKNLPAYLRDERHMRVLFLAGEYELAREWQAGLSNHFTQQEAA